jgi:hypothetical protein
LGRYCGTLNGPALIVWIIFLKPRFGSVLLFGFRSEFRQPDALNRNAAPAQCPKSKLGLSGATLSSGSALLA